jgi:cupin fold WbuC family metalloprotein
MEDKNSKPPYPQALAAPTGQVILISRDLVRQAVEGSRSSPRRRIILPLHKSNENTLHRMLNAGQPGTYVRPHWHRDPPKDESLVLIQGEICIFLFEEDGRIRQAIRLKAGSNEFGIDIGAGIMHTFVVLEPDTVVYETKPGPYVQATDKSFASWAPPEGSAQAAEYLATLCSACPRT